MIGEIEWIVPQSFLCNLERAPTDRPVALLLRHSTRGPIPAGEAGGEVPLTEMGWDNARRLGRDLGARLRSLHSSPVRRCIQTANALREGANVDLNITVSRLLGDPGVYVLDGDLAWNNWERLGHEEVMRHFVSEDDALPGMARPNEAAWLLLRHMLSVAGDSNGLHVFVTHDSVVMATVSRLQGTQHGPSDWPHFLEGAFFWRNGDLVHIAYKEVISIFNVADL